MLERGDSQTKVEAAIFAGSELPAVFFYFCQIAVFAPVNPNSGSEISLIPNLKSLQSDFWVKMKQFCLYRTQVRLEINVCLSLGISRN